MQIKTGETVEGKVTGITKYGAFVSINGEVSGMIHISEISGSFIKDINEILKLNQTIKAVVIGTNENGKLALSIKQLSENAGETIADKTETVKPSLKHGFEKPEEFVRINKNSGNPSDFEDMISKFKRESDEKMTDLKSFEPKRSGQPRRRKDKD